MTDYLRPKRLIYPATSIETPGSFSYIRNAMACINFTRGFEKSEVGYSLSVMIDQMAIHLDEYGGIPSDPHSYVCGLIGTTPRRWKQTIEPTLIAAKRIRKVTRNGIKVWVFPDNKMKGPHALFRMASVSDLEEELLIAEADQKVDEVFHGLKPEDVLQEGVTDPDDAHDWKSPDDVDTSLVDDAISEIHKTTGISNASLGRRPEEVSPDDLRAPDTVNPPAPVHPVHQEVNDVDTIPVEKPATTPTHTAYDVLKQAGVDVDNHERGQFYWLRQDHNIILQAWLEKMPVNKIVDRIARAKHEDRLPKIANSLAAFEDIVFGEVD